MEPSANRFVSNQLFSVLSSTSASTSPVSPSDPRLNSTEDSTGTSLSEFIDITSTPVLSSTSKVDLKFFKSHKNLLNVQHWTSTDVDGRRVGEFWLQGSRCKSRGADAERSVEFHKRSWESFGRNSIP